MVHIDKSVYLDSKAHEAEQAFRRHDTRAAFAIVKALSGNGSSARIVPVRKIDGTLTANEEERQLRWQEHFLAFA